MEYAAGGDMFEYVVRKGGLRESEARWFFQQLIVATDYIHRMVRIMKILKLIFVESLMGPVFVIHLSACSNVAGCG